MLSKRLVGAFMFLGPILTIVMIIVDEGFISGSSFAEDLKVMSDNYALATITTVGYAIAILVIFIGIHGLARSMQGEDKPGSDLAGLASIFAMLLAGVFMVSLGLQLVATEQLSEWVKEGGDPINAFAISEAIGRSLFVFNGIVTLFLGLAILRQKNMSQIVGGFFTFFAVCTLVGGMFSSGDNWGGMMWFIGFLGFPIITSVTGFLTLREARKEPKK
ncbi:MAG TPA: hypothetical protein EYG21_00940 [Nitrospinaceae bacterium]|jgi:hypothetical protein|nr:hypothetical protein [Nitrospinaceae bacterium]